MTARKNKGKYEVCTVCGAHLDHGEQCDCESLITAAVYGSDAVPIYKEETGSI